MQRAVTDSSENNPAETAFRGWGVQDAPALVKAYKLVCLLRLSRHYIARNSANSCKPSQMSSAGSPYLYIRAMVPRQSFVAMRL